MKYFTSKEKLLYPEYGRHVQEMVNELMTVEDREKRTRMAKVVVSIMKQLTNANEEHELRKLWDHLIIMTDYKIDVDCPYERPTPESKVKPKRPEYKKFQPKAKAFGSIIEGILRNLPKVEEEKRPELINRLANLMKNKYVSYNQESVTDEIIIKTLKRYSEDIGFDVSQIELASLKDMEKSKKKHKNSKR